MTRAPKVNPQALRLEEAAKLFTHFGQFPVTIAMLRADIAAGTSVNKDGTLHVVHYIARLVREMLDNQ